MTVPLQDGLPSMYDLQRRPGFEECGGRQQDYGRKAQIL